MLAKWQRNCIYVFGSCKCIALKYPQGLSRHFCPNKTGLFGGQVPQDACKDVLEVHSGSRPTHSFCQVVAAWKNTRARGSRNCPFHRHQNSGSPHHSATIWQNNVQVWIQKSEMNEAAVEVMTSAADLAFWIGVVEGKSSQRLPAWPRNCTRIATFPGPSLGHCA